MRWEVLRQEFLARPGFREEFEREYPYHDLSIEIGGLRADRDMTQTEFGKLVGVPQSTVARLESGQQNPSVGMLMRLAKATGTELVIEFREPKSKRTRKRRAATRRRRASSSGGTKPSERAAASPAG
jgi:transcriptional regulator with XRE-family HTH domain